MYFRQFWKDPRLMFEKKPTLDKLVVGAEYIQEIWVPDTFFVNEKTAYFHKATTENQFLRILYTGEILRSIRWATKRAQCRLNLKQCAFCFMDVLVMCCFIFERLCSTMFSKTHLIDFKLDEPNYTSTEKTECSQTHIRLPLYFPGPPSSELILRKPKGFKCGLIAMHFAQGQKLY